MVVKKSFQTNRCRAKARGQKKMGTFKMMIKYKSCEIYMCRWLEAIPYGGWDKNVAITISGAVEKAPLHKGNGNSECRLRSLKSAVTKVAVGLSGMIAVCH